jgi:hypothetical protein
MPTKRHDFFLGFLETNTRLDSLLNTKSEHNMYPLNGFTTFQ